MMLQRTFREVNKLSVSLKSGTSLMSFRKMDRKHCISWEFQKAI